MSASADPRIDTVIAGKYRIERRIARGGMGSVYLATHELMNRKVAIKLLHEDLGEQDQSEVFFKRFLREARATSQLQHPNAVMIYDFGLENEIPYLAMQYIDGRNISAILADSGPFLIQRAMPLFEQICSAIQAAHKLTIAHRDIKPDNIIIQTSEQGVESAHVLDFGIAKAMEGSNTMVGAMTAVGKTVGTPRYMSPEQALGREVDLRTDVYSLGIVLYEMLVGDIPFSADTPVQLMYEHLNSEPKPLPSSLNLPSEFEKILFKALAKEPDARFNSPMDLANALKNTLDSSQETNQPTLAAFFHNNKMTTIGIASSVLLIILLFVRFTNRDAQITLKQEEIATTTSQTVKGIQEEKKNIPTVIATTPAITEEKSSALTLQTTQDPTPTKTLDTAVDESTTDDSEAVDNTEPINETKDVELRVSQMSNLKLITNLGAENRAIRIEAAIELQKRGEAPVPKLIQALRNSPSARVRFLCVFILGKIGAQEAAPALRVATTDESGMVAETAKRALKTLGR